MKHKKLWIFILIVAADILLNHLFGWSDFLRGQSYMDYLKDLVQSNLPLAVLIYSGVTIAGCVVLALPGVTFAIIAGVLFGPLLGTVCCSVATTLGAMLAFVVGRFFLKDSVKPVAEKNKYIRKWLFDQSGHHQLFVLMITRLVPLFPYNLQNFAYGVTDISFGTYSLGSLLFMLPGTAMYTIGFAGIADREHRWLYLGIALAMAAVVTVISMILRKRYFSDDEKADMAGDTQQTNAYTLFNASACIHCHACQEGCAFLSKYHLDIGDERLREYAFHCFLCGRCSSVCPKGINGRGMILDYRREAVSSGEFCPEKEGHRMMLLEKKHYRFQSYRHAKKGSVLFPGCSFPSYYPETTKELVRMLKEHRIGVVYDCCGKPVGELGLQEEEKRITDGIQKRLEEKEVTEVITVCPNCYYFLQDRLSIPVVSIYDKLYELGIGEPVKETGELFVPCPDRRSGLWRAGINHYLEDGAVTEKQMQCCGLGGRGFVSEPELAKEMTSSVDEQERLYVCCASCAGKLKRDGRHEVKHLLPEIIGTREEPDTGKALINRAMFRVR